MRLAFYSRKEGSASGRKRPQCYGHPIMALYAGHFDFAKPLLHEVPALYSPEECRAILDSVAGSDWLAATVNSHDGRVVDKNVRDSLTAVVKDTELARGLFERVRPHVPPEMVVEDPRRGARVTMDVIGIYVPLRVYRYEPGQHFGLHQDQAYAGPDGSRSLLTLMVYLNEDFEGGETDFPEQARTIFPKTGAALWFQHMLLHSGKRVSRGSKYVLRSDVLYRARG
jgi:prolyl 4-hydroxylase